MHGDRLTMTMAMAMGLLIFGKEIVLLPTKKTFPLDIALLNMEKNDSKMFMLNFFLVI